MEQPTCSECDRPLVAQPHCDHCFWYACANHDCPVALVDLATGRTTRRITETS